VQGRSLSESVLHGRAEIHVRWRSFRTGALVTVTIVNAVEGSEDIDRMWDDMLLQVELGVRAEDGEILEYPSQGLTSHDPKEEGLRLIYRDSKTYAVGHGCAVEWDELSPVRSVRTEVMPRFEVPTIRAAGRTCTALDPAWLADPAHDGPTVFRELSTFISGYREWALAQHRTAASMNANVQVTSTILARIDEALERMDRGAEVLRDSPEILRCFQLANETMRRQMRHSAKDLAVPAAHEPMRRDCPLTTASMLSGVPSSSRSPCSRSPVSLIHMSRIATWST
jgi:hypothetical protein